MSRGPAGTHHVVTMATLAMSVGCSDPMVGSDSSGPSSSTSSTTSTTSGGTTVASGSTGGPQTTGADDTTGSTLGSSSTSGDEPPFLFDQGIPDMPPPSSACQIGDGMNAVGDCREQAPAESFTPELQWEWLGEGADTFVVVTPLVANLTDDNGDGSIDLCDVPDVVVVSSPGWGGIGHIYVLDGETGALHYSTAQAVHPFITPALGDIDDDGLPEIITISAGSLTAFNHDMSVAWVGPTVNLWWHDAVSLADLDGDGNVEIMLSDHLFDHDGTLLWTANGGVAQITSATTAADLDGDGDLEVVIGSMAVHHDGQTMWNAPVAHGLPQVADLDDDGLPEVLLTTDDGLTLIEHDGTVTYQALRPTGISPGSLHWIRPAAIHDFDGDGLPEYAMSSANNYTVYEADASIVWSAMVDDASGIAGGTAFDFLGDGEAEAMYADQWSMFVFDAMGGVQFQTPRVSGTAVEYPVVADIDNDGSAEIVVVGNEIGAGLSSPSVQVIRDADDRWIQARRIWNQHTYHVTNVNEDGTIPQFEPPHWLSLNTFRTNAQIEGGDVCIPNPLPPE